MVVCFIAACQQFVHKSSKDSADQRSDDKHPYIHKSISAGKNGRTEASCRVDGRTCEMDAKDMNKGERQTDNNSGNRAIFGL